MQTRRKLEGQAKNTPTTLGETKAIIIMTVFMTPKQRSQTMSKVRGYNIKPEKLIRSYSHSQGFRFRINSPRKWGLKSSYSKDYEDLVSKGEQVEENLLGHILTLSDRSIFTPDEQKFWPEQDNLQLHIKRVFRLK